MADAVDIPSDTPENDLHEPAFDELRQLKREMQVRGSLLGKTWSELSSIMDKYQARLVETHDQVETSGTPIDHRKFYTLEKRVSELEHKLLAKDSEIVELRTEVHQYKNEVTMKDNLIEKIQNQMAKEAIEFQTEINSLKDMLDRQNGGFDVSGVAGTKRRKIVTKTSVSPKERSTPSTNIPPVTKTESARSSCQLVSSTPVFPSPQPVGQSNAFESSNQSESENSVLDVPDDSLQYGAHFKLEQTDDFPEEVYAGLEQDFDTSQDEDTLLVAGAVEAGQSSQVDLLRLQYLTNTSSQLSLYKERNFVCRFCSKRFMNKQHLTFHLRIHLGLMPYRCLLCPKRFRQSGTCIRHIKNVHKECNDPHRFLLREEEGARVSTMTYHERNRTPFVLT